MKLDEKSDLILEKESHRFRSVGIGELEIFIPKSIGFSQFK